MRPARSSHLFLLALGLLLMPLTASAQPAESLQSPAAFLGYEIGEQFTPHHRVVDYVRHVAEHSPRVTHRRYGTSVEGRPLLLATVTTPDNQDRVETLRRDNLKRAGFADGEPQASPTAIVWLSYGVHGNESVSTEAALRTLYALGNPQNARTGGWLDNTVVLLDPLLNPDGRARYVQWYKRMTGDQPNVRPSAREHHEPWPGGRSNHYYFDLNRDWAWGTQSETRQRLEAYHRWMPHVHVDFHEMGVDEPYYFAPATRPYHESLTQWQQDFQFTIGQNNADYFNENGWLYFTEEVFDLFYPGYGDTWPLFNGAIGMTYEQGGSGRAGRGIVTAEGDTLTLTERMRHHHTTGLSTVEATANNYERVVQEFADYYASAQEDPPGDYRTYVIRRDDQGHRLDALADHLDEQQIRYGYVTESRSVRGYAYRSGETEQTRLQRGDLIVNAAQPKSRLAKVLLEPKTTITDSLMYDITAWGLPYAYGLEAYALTDRVTPDTDTMSPASATLSGDGASSPYAYVTPWTSRADAQFAAALLDADLHLRFATRSFTVDDRSYEPGTLVITRVGNTNRTDRFDATVRRLAEAHDQSLHAVSTGLTAQGPDFGSGNFGFVDAPHVAALSGPPTVSARLGEVWHFFDRQLNYPVTLLSADDFEATMLDDVDVLVLPSGYYGDWLTSERADALTEWVRRGGRLVAMGNANSALSSHDAYALTRQSSSTKNAEDDPALSSYGTQTRERLAGATPGSVHRVHLDDSHPLGFGIEPPYFTLKRNDDTFAYLDDGWTVGALTSPTPVSGFMGHEAQQKVDDTLLFGTQSLGDGQVTYLVDNPLFRGFWYNGQVLFANAVFFVGNQ